MSTPILQITKNVAITFYAIDDTTRSTIQHVQNTPFCMKAGFLSPNFYTPDLTKAVSTIDNTSTSKKSKNNTKSRFQNRSPIQFDIGKTIEKGKSIENAPEIDLLGEEIEDEHGYTERIEGISNEYVDHGDPTEQCGALLWLTESKRGSTNATTTDAFSICCGRGKVKLPIALKSPLTLLSRLLKGEHPKSNSFMDNIRRYNSMFAFTWMSGKKDNMVNSGRGPFSFRIQGENNHVIGDLVPKKGETPKASVISETPLVHRINVVSSRDNASSSSTKDIDRQLTKDIKSMLDINNPLVQRYRYVGGKLASGDQNVKIRLLGRRPHDGRQYNLPTANEVAALIVGDFDSMPDERDIIVHENSGNLKTISELHVSYLPLQYPLLFPYAEDGYRTDIYHKGITDDTPENKKKYVTMREWFAYNIQDRQKKNSTI
ncbi:hypothetical protein Tco_1024723 [Tanacetum coccineum]